jgi:hypothetical protein
MLQTKHRPGRHRPRRERDRERARRAAEAARLAPTPATRPALAAALAQIGAAFDEAAAINAFKMRVERLITLGPDHPVVRARFGARVAMLYGRDLDAAIVAVERWWRDARAAFAIASAFGRGSRLSLDVLSELRLVLRLVRFKKMEAAYQAAFGTPHEWPAGIAAE